MPKFKMTNRHYKAIEVMLTNPSLSYEKLADLIGCNRNTITEWKRNPIFMEEYQKRLREMWKDSEAIAVQTMINLASEGDFKASKYILDSQGYAPVQKIEAEISTDIEISIGDED